MILETERLTLRPLREDDVDALWPHVTDPTITRHMAWKPHADRRQTLGFVRAEMTRLAEGRGATWAILHGEEFCGIVSLIGLLRQHRDLTYDRAELAYWLAAHARGRGFMTEAVRAVLQFGFSELRLHKIVVSHFAVNDASRSLIHRIGMRHVGTQVKEFMKDGVWHDHVLYEMLHEEYSALAVRGARSP